jgi:hypothetical protein
VTAPKHPRAHGALLPFLAPNALAKHKRDQLTSSCSKITLCGVEWASPEALLTTAPWPVDGHDYKVFFEEISRWSRPFLDELCDIDCDKDQEILVDEYINAISRRVKWWQPLEHGWYKDYPYLNGKGGLSSSGEIDLDAARTYLTEPRWYNTLPPPPVLRWILESMREHYADETSLDECFGIVPKGGNIKQAIKAEHSDWRALGYSYRMALLTDNGLSVFEAAELVKARDEMLEAYFGKGTELCLPLGAEKIQEHWSKWKKQFVHQLNLAYYKNDAYLAAKKESRINFFASKSRADYVQWRESVELIRRHGEHEWIYGADLEFPLEALNRAKSQGLKISF